MKKAIANFTLALWSGWAVGLSSCSPGESPEQRVETERNVQDAPAVPAKLGALNSPTPEGKATVSGKPVPAAQANESFPTRSELRVIAEQARLVESDVQEVIKRLDGSMDDPEGRRQALESFQKLLPEYKEKMLALGKAKLQAEGR